MLQRQDPVALDSFLYGLVARIKQENCSVSNLSSFYKFSNVDLSAGVALRCHVKGHVPVQLYVAALSETGAGPSRVGGCSESVGSQESHEQGPAAPGPEASSLAAAAPGGPGPSIPGPVQGHGHSQHLHVWGYERNIRGAEGPRDGQRPDGDGA